MFRIDKNAQKCPSFIKAIFELNDGLFPNSTPLGFNMTVNTNVSKLFGRACATTDGGLVFTNQLSMDALNRHGYKYGFSYNNATDGARSSGVHGYATVRTLLEADARGELTASVSCVATKNSMFSVWGQREWNGEKSMVSLLEWSDERYNASAELSFDPVKTPEIVFSTSHMFRVNGRWSVGNYLMVRTERSLSCGSVCRPSNARPISFGGAFRYDGDGQTVTALVDGNANVTLQYQRRVNGALTVGAQVCADVTRKTVNTTWRHRVKFDGGGLEMRGLLNTNGTVMGHLRKVFSSSNHWSFVVGITTSLDHKKNTVGLGIDAEINIGTQCD